jgi:hypothetical protein
LQTKPVPAALPLGERARTPFVIEPGLPLYFVLITTNDHTSGRREARDSTVVHAPSSAHRGKGWRK